ncbi:MAG TPA: outer membrane protein assembly factor BamD [Gemmatimonadales bacterium]
MKARYLALLLVVAACGGYSPGDVGPARAPGAASLSPAALDSLWSALNERYEARDWDETQALVDRFLLEAPANDSRVIEARMMLGEVSLERGNRLEAAREFRRVSDETPSHPLAPKALLRVGDAHAELWRRPELDPTYGYSALATYQELLNRYPESAMADSARLRIARLNDWFAEKAYKAARYYLRLKAYDSAIIYLRDLLATWPQAAIAPEALLRLIGAYRSLGYLEDVRETCEYLRRFHPDTPDADEACGALTPAAPSS